MSKLGSKVTSHMCKPLIEGMLQDLSSKAPLNLAASIKDVCHLITILVEFVAKRLASLRLACGFPGDFPTKLIYTRTSPSTFKVGKVLPEKQNNSLAMPYCKPDAL